MKRSYTVMLLFSMMLAPSVAQAAYCGTPADTLAVQSAAIAKFNASTPRKNNKIDQTYIMAVVVLKNRYAEADISYAGQMSYYLQKNNGRWVVIGTSAPKNWPSAITKRLTMLFNQRSRGSKACTNPRFVPRGSG